MIRAKLVRGEQSTVLELEINSSRANRARDEPQAIYAGPGWHGSC